MSAPAATRPAYRPYAAQVTAVQPLSANYVRLSFSGPDFGIFGRQGLDQRVKLILPLPGGRFGDFGQNDESVLADGSWYARWRTLPDDERNPIRTYTARGFDPISATLTVDFALHQPAGPATAWAASAQVGDELIIVGPDARAADPFQGIDFRAGLARHVLLVGDETAVPAICGIIESGPIARTVHVIAEVPAMDDVPTLHHGPHIEVSWAARGDAPPGATLVPRLESFVAEHSDWFTHERLDIDDVDVDHHLLWESPAPCADRGFYAWVAGEAGVVRDLRRYLLGECGLDRKHAVLMGYWRQGKAERQQ